MAFTTAIKISVACLTICLAMNANAASIGLSTRDQNPMLQAFYLPSIDMQQANGWTSSNSLYITNTFQKEKEGNETLRIDVENYRYDFSLAYQANDWRIGVNLPFIANDSGSLDGLIEDWHDFFGLPQGGRTSNPDDQINLSYIRNDITVFQQNKADSDFGDIALSFNYRLAHHIKGSTEIGIGLELPTGSVESNSGNEEIDVAFWLGKAGYLTENTTLYGLVGLSLPGKGGQLEDRIKDQIWLVQAGTEYQFTYGINGIMQFDFHTATLKNTELTAFGSSLQIQLALQFKNWFDNYHIDLFFSEDIMVKSAPDITFGLRVSRIAFD